MTIKAGVVLYDYRRDEADPELKGLGPCRFALMPKKGDTVQVSDYEGEVFEIVHQASAEGVSHEAAVE